MSALELFFVWHRMHTEAIRGATSRISLVPSYYPEALLVISLDGGGYADLAPRTKGHLHNLMRVLWNCAMRWELTDIGENPMKLVRVRG